MTVCLACLDMSVCLLCSVLCALSSLSSLPPANALCRFIAISPSKKAVACQAAMEIIPLVMEPESDFYVDPVIVLVSAWHC